MQPPVNRDQSTASIARRLLRAAEMYDEGVEITRARLLRQYPDASAQEISKRIGQWLRRDRQSDGVHLVPAKCPRFSTTS